MRLHREFVPSTTAWIPVHGGSKLLKPEVVVPGMVTVRWSIAAIGLLT